MWAGVGLPSGAAILGETRELAEMRRQMAGYAGRVTVRSDSPAELDVLCEIKDLSRFAADLGGIVPEGATARVSGNLLSFEHRGRQVRVENVLRA